MAKTEKHALYLVDEKGHIQLFPANEVDEKLAAGWKEPDTLRANGYRYNGEEDLLTNDAQAEVAKVNADIADKKAKEQEKEAEKNRKANEEASKDVTQELEYRSAQPVKVIDPPSN